MLYSQEKFFLAEPMGKSRAGNQNTVYLIFLAHVASYRPNLRWLCVYDRDVAGL